MRKSYEPLKLLVIASILNDTGSFTYRMKLFMHLRNLCGNTILKEMNPSENLCRRSLSGFCDIGICPLLRIPLISKQ